MTDRDNMSEDTQTDIVIGLSDDERGDLEKMIKKFEGDPSASPSDSSIENIQKQIESIIENLVHLDAMFLKFDEKMKSFYKILHLFFKKNEILNRRIDDIVKIMEGQRNP